MPEPFSLFIKGQPKPQGRARVGRRGTYYSDNSGPWRMTVQAALRPFKIAFPEGKLTLALLFYLDPEQPGDTDNFVKAVLDAGNKYLYTDDKQIRCLFVERTDASEGAQGLQIFCGVWVGTAGQRRTGAILGALGLC